MVKCYYVQDYPEYSGSVWPAKNSLENNVSNFSINNTVYERLVGRKKRENRAQMQSWKQVQF